MPTATKSSVMLHIPSPDCRQTSHQVAPAYGSAYLALNGHSPEQLAAIDQVRAEVGSCWLTVNERHLVADFVAGNRSAREAALRTSTSRLLPSLQRLHNAIEQRH